MIKKILLALFTIWYASVSLVIFGMKINHHSMFSHNEDGSTHTAVIANGGNCNVDSESCINCGDGGGTGCCSNETTCFVKCSKGVGLYAYTNPKDEDHQTLDAIDTTSVVYFVSNREFSDYKIVGNRKKQVDYQVSQSPHYRVGIIQLVL